MFNIFIDGREGTTGLQIVERLKDRSDIRLTEIPNQERKNPEVKKKYLNQADLVILCLPDEASRESVALIENDQTRVIDSSTAFRALDGWIYGIPELDKGQRDRIRQSKRLTNPGCHATGFIMALYPLIQEGVAGVDYPVFAQSLTGYSGGGKKLIAVYESGETPKGHLQAPRHYALNLRHKHLAEMQKHTGLLTPPLFTPIVANYYQGMVVSIPLLTRLLRKKISAREVREVLAAYYQGEPFVRVMPFESGPFLDNGFLSPLECNHTNRIDLFVFGDEEQILVAARLDNLGKGASGAAVQNMNLMLGMEETLGLNP
ncbi:MAG: N-acetyl-gamma-glutamyl-phosphate reductase [Thermodesulfobacteriota bacterium]